MYLAPAVLITLFPQKFKDQYGIDALAKGDFVYMEIRIAQQGQGTCAQILRVFTLNHHWSGKNT